MTCDEYRKMCERDPEDCTASENWAGTVHSMNCEACGKWLESMAASQAPPSIQDIKEILQLADKNFNELLNDPEGPVS